MLCLIKPHKNKILCLQFVLKSNKIFKALGHLINLYMSCSVSSSNIKGKFRSQSNWNFGSSLEGYGLI